MSPSSVPSLQAYLSCCDNHRLYGYTGRLIPGLALLGYDDVAGRLISRLNNYDLYHDSYPWSDMGDLWFLWDLRAKQDGVPWPEGEEEKVRQAVRKRRAKRGSSDAATVDNSEPINADDIQRELELRANEPDRPSTITRMLSDAQDIMQSLETAGSTIHISTVRSRLAEALGLVLAAEAQHERHEEGKVLDLRGARASDELLRWLAYSLGERYHDNWVITRSRQAWKLYKSGALRRALNIDEAALTAFANDFETALDQRLTNGRIGPSTRLSVPELLKAAEDVTQAIKTDPEVQENSVYAKDTSLFNSPATEEQIAQAEARLGITLPSDYTAFLRISNGTTGHMWGHPLGDFQPPLHAVDKVRWLDPVEEDYFTGLALDIPARWANWPFAPPPTAKGYGDYLEHFVIGRALELGIEDIDNVWLIPPSTITPIKDAVKKVLEDTSLSELDKNSVRNAVRDFAGSEEEWEKMEWACVTWASGGTVAMFFYPGFKAWLEHVVEHGGVTAYTKDEDQDEGTKMLRSQKWLGSLFGSVEGREGLGEVPGWLRDAVSETAQPRRWNLT